MEIKVCVGSACYVKGSHEVIQQLEKLIKEYELGETLVLKAAFCLGHCTQSVSVQLEEDIYGVAPQEVETFFKEEICRRLNLCK